MDIAINYRISLLIKNLGISPSDFANRIGITPAAVFNYTNNLREPKASVLSTIVKEFDINADWLLTGIGEMSRQQTAIQNTAPMEENSENWNKLKQEIQILKQVNQQHETLKQDLKTFFATLERIRMQVE